MIRINLFGPTTVTKDGQSVTGTGFGGRKPRELLGLLAMQPGLVHRRDDAAEQLWDGHPPQSYVTTLQGYMCVLRRSLSRIGAESCLVSAQNGYFVDPDLVEVDVAESYRGLGRRDASAVLAAVDASAAGLLPQVGYVGWAQEARREWNQELAEAATVAAATANAAGDHFGAVRLGRVATAGASYSESALRELMRALAALGNVSEALRLFNDFRGRLREELGVEPHAETCDLYLDLLNTTRGEESTDVPVLLSLLRDALSLGARAPKADRDTWTQVGQLLVSRAC